MGGLVAKVAASKLRRPLIPWQRHAVDVSQEILTEGPRAGYLAYDLVIIEVPRQAGKTMGFLFPLQVARCLVPKAYGYGQRALYTAQDRNHAREKLEEDFIEVLDQSALVEGRDYTKRLANGSERLRFLKSRSTITISATHSSAGHGKTLNLPGIDEAWEHVNTDVDQGFRVPMITQRRLAPGAQLVIVSTEGDKRSNYLRKMRRLGMEAVERGDDTGVCFLDWGGSREDDIWDRQRWWFIHPGLGHLIEEVGLAAEARDMDLADFQRAYFNLEQLAGGEDSPIGLDAWEGRVDLDSKIEGRLVFGVDVPEARDIATVGVAGERAAGGAHVEMMKTGPGTTWAVDYLAERVEEHGAEGVAIAPSSPAGSLIGSLEAKGVKVFKMSPQKQAQAAGSFYDGVVNAGLPVDPDEPGGPVVEGLWHIGQDELAEALEGAQKRTVGEGAWVWDQKASDGDISPLKACTLALGALMSLEEEQDMDSIYDELEGFGDW